MGSFGLMRLEGDAAWERVAERLVAALESLADGEFLVLAEPDAPGGPRRGLLRRRVRPGPIRYVQYLRIGSWLKGECVGAASFGGDWDVTASQDGQIRGLGWRAPGDVDETEDGTSYPNYRRTLPREEFRRAATMGVAALHVLGADPEGLSQQRSS